MDWSGDCLGYYKIDPVLSVGSLAYEVCFVWAEFRLSIPSDLFELLDWMFSDIAAGKGVLLIGEKDSQL